MTKLYVFIGLSISNFSYAYFTTADYDRSTEVTFFQGVAIISLLIVEKLNKKYISEV